jgi:ubiquinone/menaquinone biosynthesis C-methylase UbiE
MPVASAQREITVSPPGEVAVGAEPALPVRVEADESTAAGRWRASVIEAYQRRRSDAPPRFARYYRRRIAERLSRIVIPNSRVLDVGCGTGELLAALRPSVGVGIDLRKRPLQEARRRHPQLRFVRMRGEDVRQIHDTFDYVVLCQALGEIYDLRVLFGALQSVCHSRTRLVIVHYSRLWQPALKVAEWLRIKQPGPTQNWIPSDEARHLLTLCGFETVAQFGLTIAPLYVPVVSPLLNRVIGNLPAIHHLGLNYVIVARTVDREVIERSRPRSATIVVPARNEAGHIEPLLKRIPPFAPRQEVIFVEGGSTDDTWDRIRRAVREYKGPFDVKCLKQSGTGKGDAVREGFRKATGDVLMILDADISVPPEELPAFYEALASGRGEFINGSRMVYPRERRAMRFLNLLGNKFFGCVFTYLLQQRFRDTLCGTKVLMRADYSRIAANRSSLGCSDPFGDFDLLFGAARLNLKIIDMPIHYGARVYGETNISRFRHGWMLLRMCFFAARRLRFV